MDLNINAAVPKDGTSGIDREVERRIVRKALLTRISEERLLQLFSEGKLSGTLHTCIGQELVGAVITELLSPGDVVFSNHRGHGHFLSLTDNLEGLIAELMGRQNGVCGGFGGSQHLCFERFFSNGIQGGIVPVAAGVAFAKKLDETEGIVIVFIGDGTLGEGSIYEAFNLAAKWQLPLLVVLEDNGIAQSTPQRQTLAGSIASRAAGFGLGYASSDTWNWQELLSQARQAVDSVRSGAGPFLLHVKTYRLKAHSKGDDTRPRTEVETFERKDPVNQLLADPAWTAMVDELRTRVGTAVAAAESSPTADYSPPATQAPSSIEWHTAIVPKERLVRALNHCFSDVMGRDQRVVMIGEDIESPYGGAFKVTEGLSDAFPGRVRNSPISEAGIVGLGSGLALMGWKPVIEIMFGDFLGLAFDQLINHAAKFQRMYNGQVGVDLIVRTPMGGRRGYGPTHSQTLDRHFLGAPGLRVLALNNLLRPDSLYVPLFEAHCGPTLVLENKLAYGAYLHAETAPGFTLMHSSERFPTAWLVPAARKVDITLLGYGGMSEILVTAAEQLFQDHDLLAQVLCPSQIYPFDATPLLPVLASSAKMLIVEEGQGFAGFGAEVLAQVAELASEFLGEARRVVPPPDIIPSSGKMEKLMLPSLEYVIAQAVDICR
jgi:2-oxoisovalerate dehydrogenase E1 component